MNRMKLPFPLLLLAGTMLLAAPASEACQYCDREVQCSEDVWKPCKLVSACFPVVQPPEPRSYSECYATSTGCQFRGTGAPAGAGAVRQGEC